MILLFLLLFGCSESSSTTTMTVPTAQQAAFPSPLLVADQTWEGLAIFEPTIIHDETGYRLYYTGWNGMACGVGLATSADGLHWTKYPGNPILGQGNGVPSACRNNVLAVNGMSYLYYAPGDGSDSMPLNVATSHDGVSFTPMPHPVLSPTASFINYANTFAWATDHGYFMLVDVRGVDGIWRTAVAFGETPLIFTLLSDQPVTGLADPNAAQGGGYVEVHEGVTHFWYCAAPAPGNLPTDLWHATSTDLLHWTKDEQPLLTHQGTGWAFDQVCDPYLVHLDDRTIMYFDGDNNTPPLRGAIGIVDL